MKSIRAWFPTLIYNAPLQRRGARVFNAELVSECAKIRAFDRAGRRWSEKSYPGGYTSYGSLDKLHKFSSTFDRLRELIDPHVRAYARAAMWDMQSRKLVMTDCWLNIMPRGTSHSFHLHPQSVVSGTYYVQTPRGCPGLKFEDPRLSKMMAAPPRQAKQRTHIEYPARAGQVILFESWLRHEVAASRVSELRISVSFNYHLM